MFDQAAVPKNVLCIYPTYINIKYSLCLVWKTLKRIRNKLSNFQGLPQTQCVFGVTLLKVLQLSS